MEKNITVQELIELLEEQDPTAVVVLSSDPEGNNYSPIKDLESGYFNLKDSEYYSDDDFDGLISTDVDEYLEDDEEHKKPHGVPCVVIWPVY